MNKLPEHWTLFEDAELLAQKTVAIILELAHQAIEQRGEFHLVTAGGTTPNRCYQLLAETDHQAAAWSKWFIYIGDERVLPADDAERNSQALHQAWLSKVSIPTENIFVMETELGMETAAQKYRQLLAKVAEFDLVLLGMGEDGHTASLFPGHPSLLSLDSVVCEINSPKPPAERVSLSKPRLEQTRAMIKLITGQSKYPAIQAWLQGETLPIQQVEANNTQVFIDHQAWLGR